MPKTYGYVRVSRDHQRNSFEAQQVKVKAAAIARGLPPISFLYCDNDVSGNEKFADRPEGRRLLLDAEKGDHVICVHVDRLGRRMGDILHTVELLEDRGVIIHAIDCGGIPYDTGTMVAKVFLAIMAWCAEMERQRNIDRQKAVNAWRRANGYAVGSIPRYGFMYQKIKVEGRKKLERIEVPDPAEAQKLEFIMAMWAGGFHAERIAKEMNAKGWRLRNGNEWYQQRVQQAISQERVRRFIEKPGQQPMSNYAARRMKFADLRPKPKPLTHEHD